jgi:hypothetical protein
LGELQLNKIEKKLIALLISLLISSSILSTVSATSFNNDDFQGNIENTTKKIVTLSRYGLDGSVTLIKVEIEVNQGENINDKIEEKCAELLKNDPELQKLLENNITKNSLSLIRSKGRGLHVKFIPSITFPTTGKISQLLSPDKYRKIRIPIIYCKYPNDANAFTTTSSLFHVNNTNTTTGPHSVLCIGFYGYKWWLGHISWRGFLIRTGFVGISIYTKINSL